MTFCEKSSLNLVKKHIAQLLYNLSMMDTDIKLIALDIDGTIMDKACRISGRVKKAISKASEKGVYVLLATGRMYSATAYIGRELNLKTPLVVYQGSLVREFYKSDKILLHYSLDTALAYRLIRDARKKDVQINVYLNDKIYVENESPILQEYVDKRTVPFYKADCFENMENFLPTKIIVMDYDSAKVEDLEKEFRGKYAQELNITKSTDYFCEFINKKCSKASGIMFLAEKWGIKNSEIMAIGDHDNDREMLDIAKIGVAMGNSHENLQKIADHVTDTVDNDGAALAIEKFVL